ncbi:MAG: carboxyl transferase domain-containing protein [Acidimicrobiales bacterium]
MNAPGGWSDVEAIAAPIQGTVVSVAVSVGERVDDGSPVVVLESMKMEHVVAARGVGTVRSVEVEIGELVSPGTPLVVIDARPVAADDEQQQAEQQQAEQQQAEQQHAGSEGTDRRDVRADLAELIHRRSHLLDSGRPEAVERRHRQGRRTARENVEDLCDAGTFTEYGALAIAAQRGRRPLDELIERTPADGLIAGIGTVNADLFGDRGTSCAVLSYDYTVLAGTQGQQNHRKKDRLFGLVERLRMPVVLFAEGGGGRPGDTDYAVITGLDTTAFADYARLSGLVPLIGIASGYCFAGNAALLGCSDVIIATPEASIGMGGPAMIEGGGLGTYRPEEIGPLDVQVGNGVVDLEAGDDADAVRLAKQYLSYFQGTTVGWSCQDQLRLRACVPERRVTVYDMRKLVDILADTGSVLEIRPRFGTGMITALARVEGRPIGIVANNPMHLGGAIDSEGADKAARFLHLCEAHGLPVLFLCDTPGFMVGPEAERTAQVRHCNRMFVAGAALSVPFFTIVVRKGYGLGAQAMAGGSFREPIFTVAWPTGELGGMGLEGAVRLGFRRELEAVEDPHQRELLFAEMVERAYQHGKAINVASAFEIDDVIDPAESRRLISRSLSPTPPPGARTRERKVMLDPW